ncbi:MAG: serine/threonine protein kinase [Proteobacteria bacterium]|nr:serine/threonine protein kinase [Pseudomonadota bacterium]
MENRVYEVEIETADEAPADPASRFRIVKFYRPGRWSQEQILEEHQFLSDLAAQEVPACAPLSFTDGSTLKLAPEINIWYAVFPKVRGRAPEELSDEQLAWMGRLLARLHLVGAQRPAPNRLCLTPEQYGLKNLEFLERSKTLPMESASAYSTAVKEICRLSEPLFRGIATQRIHGDCHQGNILWGASGPFFVDFDDMVTGPCVQDLWLIVPGRDTEAKIQMDILLEGYEQMRSFDRRELRLIEPLRALRYIHFSAWIARRWQDPYFQRTFTQFGTNAYWEGQLADLREQLELIQAL